MVDTEIMNIFVEKPQMSIALNLLLVLAGILSFFNLSIRHEPNVIHKSLAIKTDYDGAQLNTIEDEITEPIEESLSAIEGVRDIFSETQDGSSYITIKLEDDADYDKVSSDVKDAIGRISAYLPKEAEKPRIYEKSKRDKVVAYLTVDSNSFSMNEAYEVSKDLFRKQLLMLGGVAKVDVWGEGERYISVSANPIKLAQYGISLSDVVAALDSEKVFASGGKIRSASGTKTIVIDSPLTSLEDIKVIPIKLKNNDAITLGDVANISIESYFEEYENIVDGQKKVILAIVPKLTANPIKVVESVRAWQEEVNSQGQQPYQVSMVVDETIPLKENIKGVSKSVIEAIIIVALVVSISLKSWKLSLIPNFIIIMCLVSSFTVVALFGFSINPIVLLAFVISVGLIVDDSIVVIESIYRRHESGETIFEATRKSLKEISFAVVVMTISIAAVYVPLAFQSGKNAAIFREFAWTLSGSVLISGIMALTLVPAMVNKFNASLKSSGDSPFWDKISNKYECLLRLLIPNFYKTLFLVLFLIGSTAYFYKQLPFETKPPEEDGIIVGRVVSKNPIHKSLKDDWKRSISEILSKDAMVNNYLVQIFQPKSIQWVAVLPPRGKRSQSDQEIGERIQKAIADNIIGPKSEFFLQNNIDSDSTSADLDIYYENLTPDLLDKLESLQETLEDSSFIESASSQEIDRKMRYVVEVDRLLLSKLGVNVDELEKQLFIYFEGIKTLNIRDGNHKFRVIVSGGTEKFKDISSLNNFFVYDKNNNPIPIGGLVEIKEKHEQEIISHSNSRRVVTITINFKNNVDFYEGVNKVKEIVAKNSIPGISWDISGKYTRMQESKHAMYVTFILCLAFIFLIFAILFNSFLDPFLVMFTVPVSIFGAVFCVWMFNGTNNFYFQIAIITLVGLISKHGVFIVDTANRCYLRDGNLFNSILSAAKQRLRPILMTTIAMISGAIPLLFNLGTDYIGQRHIAWVMIGGLLSGTLFSLFIIPVFYYKAKKLVS